MAQLTNAYDTYETKGIREELADAIWNIAPEDTPFMSNGGRGTIRNTFQEWQTDTLRDSDADNAQIQGFTASPTARVATNRIGNYTQIAADVFGVTRTNRAVDAAGRDDEMSYQLSLAAAALKLDLEASGLSNNAAVLGNDSTASKSAGIVAFLKTNTSFESTTGADPVWTDVPTAGRSDDSTPVPFTEDHLKEVMGLCHDEGAKPNMLFVGTHNKKVVSGFPGIAEIRWQATGASPQTTIGAVDVYVSDFGNLSVVASREMRQRDALFLDGNYYSYQFLRDFEESELGLRGDADEVMLTVEFSLRVEEEKAHGGRFDLTTA